MTHYYQIYKRRLADLLVKIANTLTKSEFKMSENTYREMDCLVPDEKGGFHQYAWSLEGLEAFVSQCKNDGKPMETIEDLIDMSKWHSTDEPGVVDDTRRSLAMRGVELEEKL